MQSVERFAPVHRDVRYSRCEQKQRGTNLHAVHKNIRYLYPLCSIVMHSLAWHSTAVASEVRLWPWQWFRKGGGGLIRWYVFTATNLYIPIKITFRWISVCVLCMRISAIIFWLSSVVHKFDFRLIITKWIRNKGRPVLRDGRWRSFHRIYDSLKRAPRRYDPTHILKVTAFLVSKE